MQKRTAYTIILICFIIIIAGLGYFYYVFTHKGNKNVGATLRNLVPFGITPSGSAEQPSQSQPTNTGTTIATGSNEIPALRQISKDPVAGAISFDRLITETIGSTTHKINKTFIRLVDRGTGHIFETSTSTNELGLVSNTTSVKNYEAYWGAQGDNVLLRYLVNNVVQNYLAKIVPQSGELEKSPFTLQSTSLGTNIDLVTISPKKDSFFYTAKDATGVIGVITSFDGGKRSAIFNSAFIDWVPQWATDGTILLTTKASNTVPGYAYTLSTNTGKMTKLLGNVNGLTASLNTDGGYLLYSESSGSDIALRLLNIKTGSVQAIDKETLLEKCVWSKIEPSIAYCGVPQYLPQGTYPDSWYQGLISFNDDIMMLNADTGVMTKIDLGTGAEAIDATNLFLDPSEKYLYFTNKKDLSLWSLDISGN